MQPIGNVGGPIVTPLHRQTGQAETMGQRILREETGIDSRNKAPNDEPLKGMERQPPAMSPLAAGRIAATKDQIHRDEQPAFQKEPVRAKQPEDQIKRAERPDHHDRADARADALRAEKERARASEAASARTADTRAAQRADRAEPSDQPSSARAEAQPRPDTKAVSKEAPEDTAARKQFDATLTEVRSAEKTAAKPEARELDTAM